MSTAAPTAPVAGLRQALLLTLALAVVGGLLGALVGGSAAAWGVVAGAVLLAGFLLVGVLSTHLVSALAPTLSLLVALMTYTLQVVVLGVVLLAVQSSDLLDSTLDRRWFGGTVILGALGWTVALVVGATRARIPHYHTPSDLAKSREEASGGGPGGGQVPG